MADVKPGVKTSEFWLILISIVLANILAVGLLPEDSVWAKVVVVAVNSLAALGYGLERVMVKRNNSKP